MASATSVVAPVKTGTSVRNQETNYYNTKVITLANGALQRETYRTDVKGNNGVLIQKLRVDDTGKVTLKETTTNATATEKSALQNPNSQLNQSIKSQITDAKKKLGSDANSDGAKNETFNKLEGSGNQATKPDPTGDNQSGASQEEAEKKLQSQLKDERKGTRNEFPGKGGTNPLKYPLDLKSDFQDIIKFRMIKYSPKALDSKNKDKDLSPFAERRAISDANTIGTVVLPVPSGINDTLSVNWASNDVGPLQSNAYNIASSYISGGASKGNEAVQGTVEGVQNNAGAMQQGLLSMFAESAANTTNMLSRTQGAVFNPNMELLFSGPQLRPFSFTFKLSARSSREAEVIRSIIRFFKQGMTPIRTESQLFLKAPHTFQVEYLHKNTPHNYLNKFKECALLSFTVDYTPDGQYATFSDGAMVSYQITMQFTELEPIFNDDYTEGVKSTGYDKEIGY